MKGRDEFKAPKVKTDFVLLKAPQGVTSSSGAPMNTKYALQAVPLRELDVSLKDANIVDDELLFMALKSDERLEEVDVCAHPSTK